MRGPSFGLLRIVSSVGVEIGAIKGMAAWSDGCAWSTRREANDARRRWRGTGRPIRCDAFGSDPFAGDPFAVGRSAYMDELRQIHFESNADVLELDLTAAPQTISDAMTKFLVQSWDGDS